MLLVPDTAAAASKVLSLSFAFPVISFRSWSSCFMLRYWYCFGLSATSQGGHDTSFRIFRLVLLYVQWSQGGIPLAFLVQRGYRPKTAAGGARTCPRLHHIQFGRANKMPADLVQHAHPFYFSRPLLRLTEPRRTRGLRNPPIDHMLGGVCPR